ncbi:serine hydrolase [Actinoplanes sp. NPDC049548]|uniref:serine hydrolase n=1 Tax=Actinoplanes sp. NPDC049548 TaxID=3155152 RepID=UPI00341359E3
MTTDVLAHPASAPRRSRRAAEPAPAAAPAPAAGKRRDTFLDNVRAIALIRVIVWHTLASAIISWVVASMPAMFFIGGSLLAHSLDRRPAGTVLRARLRRLLLPFWVFGGVVLTVLAVVYRMSPAPDTKLSIGAIVPWIFPLADPHGPPWEAGWATTPLWYLRCYLWLMLLTPLMLTAYRRLGLKVLLIPLAGVFVVDYLNRHADVAPAGWDSYKWYVGDICTYSFFWMLGFTHRDGQMAQLHRRARLEWAALGGVAAFIWVKVVDVPGMVVNNSYPLLLFMGIAWLGIFLAAERWIGDLSLNFLAGPVIRWLNRRSMTVYLWHPIAIVGAYWIRANLVPDLPRPMVLPIVGLLTVALCVIFGRAEDYAAGRAGQWWPGREDPPGTARLFTRLSEKLRGSMSSTQALGLGAVIAVLAVGFVVPSGAAPQKEEAATTDAPAAGGNLALPPAPSGKPDVADFTGGGTEDAAAEPEPEPTEEAAAPAAGADDSLKGKVLATVDAWRAKKKVDGVQVGLSLEDGSQVVLASGAKTDGGVLEPEGTFPVTSVTKTMTAAIILQLVAEGKISLEDKLPKLTAVPNLPYAGKVTIRQILNHTAGIKPYDQSKAYAAAKGRPLTAVTALQLVVDEPLEWTPGTQVGYSNAGYLTLGLLAEQLSGKPYKQLLAERVFGPAGMTESRLDETPTAGWAGFSAGGVVSTPKDLMAWGDALYRKKTILQPKWLAEMLSVANKFSTGLGAFPTCPCSMKDGKPVYSAIGHNGGQATIQYAPAENLVISLYLTESMWTAELTRDDVAELIVSLRKVVASA